MKKDLIKFFSLQSKAILSLTSERAKLLGHRRVGAGHLMLAIITWCEETRSLLLEKLGVKISDLRTTVECSPEIESPRSGPGTPFFGKELNGVLNLAIQIAKSKNNSLVTPEHLLVAIMRENNNTASDALRSQNVTKPTIENTFREFL